jgi:ABC-type dipeptide/oligopeptide/nickel transport system permease component
LNRAYWLLQRLMQLVPVLLGISLICFALLQMIPGDPARIILGSRASAEAVAAMRERLGLDQPALQQYLTYMGKVIRGDFGESISYKVPVSDLIVEHAPVTGFLALYVIVLAVPVAVLLGVLAARYRGSWIDHLIRALSVLGMTIPVFWLAILMLRFFSLELGWFPVSGYGNGFFGHLNHLLLPAVSISIWVIPVLVRNLRASIVQQSTADYVLAGRAKGLTEQHIFTRHILKNASLPTLNLFGVLVAYLVGGTIIVELIYGLPGLGLLMFNAILGRDYPIIQGLTLFYALATVAITLATDILSGLIDPRVKT